MRIQGSGQYTEQYPSYHIKSIPQVEINPIEQQPMDESVLEQEQPVKQQTADADNRSKTADLENLSLTFQKNESFDSIGSDRDIHQLDVQKAISDMQKDDILTEYQYFVGSQNFAGSGQSEDGIVFPKFVVE